MTTSFHGSVHTAPLVPDLRNVHEPRPGQEFDSPIDTIVLNKHRGIMSVTTASTGRVRNGLKAMTAALAQVGHLGVERALRDDEDLLITVALPRRGCFNG